MDWGDVILVAVSGLVGVVGAVVGAIANNHFSRQQMKEVWTGEERRRKSDRRRELREREFDVLSDAIDAITESMVKAVEHAGLYSDTEKAVALLQALTMTSKSHVRMLSIGDEDLRKAHRALRDSW